MFMSDDLFMALEFVAHGFGWRKIPVALGLPRAVITQSYLSSFQLLKS